MPRILLLAALLATALVLSTRAPHDAQAGFVVVTVDTTGDDNGTCDDGNCSLREALTLANTAPTEVRFDIAGPGPHAILPATPLPALTQPVIIDGTTEPDYAGSPVVVLDGALLDAGDGLVLQGGGSTLRGLVVCNFHTTGIVMSGAGGNHIESNYIGTDPSGNVGQPNTTGISIASDDNVVGGSADARNLISGNALGVEVVDGATGNAIDHNYVGTRADGVGALPNLHGVTLDQADGNAITSNVISGNIGPGITLASAGDNTVRSNGVGLNLNAEPLGNGVAGVLIVAADGDTRDNIIGGTAANAGNLIAYNEGPGVLLVKSDLYAVSGNQIFRNAIYDNDGLGIDLTASTLPPPDGVTPNDPGDLDSGPNGLQNAPQLTDAVTGSWAVAGTLQSTPNTEFRIELFVSASCDPSGHGEGDTFLGAFTFALPQDGQEAFNAGGPAEVQAGQFITATATNLATNDTSEFSNCIPIVPQGATPTATPPSPTATPAGPTPTPGGVRGDQNCDALVNSIDAAILLQFSAGLLAVIPCPDDVNNDGVLNSLDAALILQRVAGLITHF